jgi:hypothetical protein
MIGCIFCDFEGSLGDLRLHSATCLKHPLYQECERLRIALADLLADSRARQQELHRLQDTIAGFAERVAAQSELLAKKAEGRPKIVCLCGSTRFKDAYLTAQRDETLAGRIVLSVGLLGHQEGLDMAGPIKAMLDDLHLRKIDLADEVLVLNVKRKHCPCCLRWYTLSHRECDCPASPEEVPYIGDSTRREIAYAESLGKPVRYLENS